MSLLFLNDVFHQSTRKSMVTYTYQHQHDQQVHLNFFRKRHSVGIKHFYYEPEIKTTVLLKTFSPLCASKPGFWLSSESDRHGLSSDFMGSLLKNDGNQKGKTIAEAQFHIFKLHSFPLTELKRFSLSSLLVHQSSYSIHVLDYNLLQTLTSYIRSLNVYYKSCQTNSWFL